MRTRRPLIGWLFGASLIVLVVLPWAWPSADAGAAPLPQATPSVSGSPLPTTSVEPSVSPSPSESIPDESDDGSNLTPDSTGTLLALGGAVVLAVGAGAVVLIRR